jgi:hypothetical protein
VGGFVNVWVDVWATGRLEAASCGRLQKASLEPDAVKNANKNGPET